MALNVSYFKVVGGNFSLRDSGRSPVLSGSWRRNYMWATGWAIR